MPHDRTTIVSARRGGQSPADASELQVLYGEEVRADMTRAGFTVNSLADRIGIKPGTLKGYLDGRGSPPPPWPLGVLKEVARILGRSFLADLVALGYLSEPLAQQFLRQQQQLRLAELVHARSPLLVPREPVALSAGAQLAATLSTSPDPLAPEIDVRLRKLMRGIEHPLPFGELLIVELPEEAGAADYPAARDRLLSTRILPLAGQASSTFGDALDYCSAMLEEGLDYLARLRRQYNTSETAALIIVPGLLATRPMDPLALDPAFDHLDSVAVTSLHFGGAADVAALGARKAGWGYAAVSKLTQQAFGTGQRWYGGQDHPATPPSERSYHLNSQHLTELLLNPSLTGRRRVSALDEPSDALLEIHRLAASPPSAESPRMPLAMLRISSRRIQWVADRRAIARPGGGNAGDEGAVADRRQLIALQDELTRAVQSVTDRPVIVLDVPESAADYDNQDKGTVDEDFDTYVVASDSVQNWLRSLDGDGRS